MLRNNLVGCLSICLVIAVQANAANGIHYTYLNYHIDPITVFDRHGHYVGRVVSHRYYWAPLDNIPTFLQKAVIAVEDARFYEHDGIDVFGIARAMFKNMVKGKVVEGGSTITQQLVKNKYLTNKISLDRKIQEAKMALELEKKYTKNQILEMYFNEIYYGNGIYGIAQAARFYFNKNLNELTNSECVLLAGIPKNPNRYNPRGKPEDVIRRRDVVIGRMLELHVITNAQKKILQKSSVSIQKPDQAPQYLAQIRNKLYEYFGADTVERGGFTVTAALDLELQKQAECILKESVKGRAADLQGALICIDPTTGDVLAAVGDANNDNNSINRVFVSKRQSGSSIKPFVYAAAIEKGIPVSSIWNDTPISYNRGNGKLWTPLNFDKKCHGELSLRQAIAHSNNVIAVKLLNHIGIPSFVDLASKVGLTLHAQNGLSLALGTEEVTLNDITRAYTALANNGLVAEARTIIRVYSNKHGSNFEYPVITTPVMTPETAFITTQILKDVMIYGTAKNLIKFSGKYPSAGKTGTTDNCVDAWFIGYTPQLLTGVWVGYDNPRSAGSRFTGGAIAAPIWERFMSKAMMSKMVADFNKPTKVVSVVIDPKNGKLATSSCSQRLSEFFILGTEPASPCLLHNNEDAANLLVNKAN